MVWCEKAIVGFEDGRGSQAVQWPLKTEQSKETDSPLEPPKGA